MFNTAKFNKISAFITATVMIWVSNCIPIKFTMLETVAASSSTALHGDLNDDGRINGLDKLRLKQAILANTPLYDDRIQKQYLNFELGMYLFGIAPEINLQKIIDSDGDGLTDWDELNFYHTDPLMVDSDGDGIPDGDEVMLYGTNPASSDTDEDGLTDYEEIFDYGTDPLNLDSDNDGIMDGDELKLGLDPRNQRTHGYIYDYQYMPEQPQILEAGNAVFAEVNTPESPYKLSVVLAA